MEENKTSKFKYCIHTFGCQMNKSDSERVKKVLEDLSLEETQNDEEASFILLNTCSVRKSAEDRAFSLMHKCDELKKKNKKLILAMTGCMPGRDYKGTMKKKLPMVDLYFKISDLGSLPEMIMELNPEIGEYKESSHPYPLDYLNIKPKIEEGYKMFLPIQTGCNRFCSYCVVPFSRGLEKNRPFEDIMCEARSFVKNGGVYITLLGQTVNSYKFAPDEKPALSSDNPYKSAFPALLFELNKLEGLKWIFFTAPHPDDMNDELIDALALPAVMNFLHLPVQSGSNKILNSMRRNYTREQYLDIVEKVRKRVPDMAIGTDIIVGFSGETEEDFLDTVDLYKKADFDISYTAKYSVRSGTFAAKKLVNDVSYADKQDRWRRLQEIMEQTTEKKNKKYEGKVVDVLFESFRDGYLDGWSYDMKKVEVKSDIDLTGKIVKVKVNDARTWILYGELEN